MTVSINCVLQKVKRHDRETKLSEEILGPTGKEWKIKSKGWKPGRGEWSGEAETGRGNESAGQK